MLQYVKFTGAQRETAERLCDGNFDQPGKDVTCTIVIMENIGDYRCLIWRNGGEDSWEITQVILQARCL